MQRVGATLGSCAALVAVVAVAAPSGDGGRPLPLHAPLAATATLTGIVTDPAGVRLARVDPASLRVLGRSRAVGYYDGWVRAPGGKLLAVSTYVSENNPLSTLRFANATTLEWVRRAVPLDGSFRAAVWPSAGRLLALVETATGGAPRLVLETVDTVAKKVVARRGLEGSLSAVARSADGLVLLVAPGSGIGAARLAAVGADASVREVPLERIPAGVSWPQDPRTEVGSVRQPGLAVDPAAGVAYVADADGLFAEVGLRDLAVAYHEASRPPLARFAAWLTPAAEAKGANGPTRRAAWLGDGLLLVTGTDETAVAQADGTQLFSERPAGLEVVDTRDWSVRMLDPEADSAVVADGILLADGSSWRSDANGSTGDGVAAYGADGTLRWRVDAGSPRWVAAAYGRLAVVGGESRPYELVDLATGKVLRTLAAQTVPLLLLGAGS